MPDGAQSWKMIKTPGSRTDRIAQACDRCRSKKIRCDGLRPHCSQCVAVGFECKISDKLTRRAFPRGYTESLEDRIRQLESDNTRLSNLLDIKDEQMELMSRVEATLGGPYPPRERAVSTSSPSNVSPSCTEQTIPTPHSSCDAEEDVRLGICHVKDLTRDGSYRGTSSGNVFIKGFIDKLLIKNAGDKTVADCAKLLSDFSQVSDNFCLTIRPNDTNFLQNNQLTEKLQHQRHQGKSNNTHGLPSPPNFDSPESRHQSLISPNDALSNFPSRSTCDKLVTIYFEEWQSMYVILDQQRFLSDYISFLDESSANNTDQDVFATQFALVLLLGSLSCKDRVGLTKEETIKMDFEWRSGISAVAHKAWNMKGLQTTCLAVLYSLHVGNLNDVWQYRGLAVSIAQRLGLYKCPSTLIDFERNSLSDKDIEQRNVMFWTVYTLDVFASVVLGCPRMIFDGDIECSIPDNIEDQMTSKQKNNTPSCQLSTVQFSRVLAHILDSVYGGGNQKALTNKTLVMLDDQLESWRRDLPSNLKFEFNNGAPSATLSPVHQKSPLLLMLYHYGRLMIHLPCVTAVTDEANLSKTSLSNVAVMQSAKTYLQIFDYLKRRNVTPSLPLNSARTIYLLGSVVMYSAIDYSKGGALLQQTRKLMMSSLSHLYDDMKEGSPGALTPQCYELMESTYDQILCGSNHAILNHNKHIDETRRKRASKVKVEPAIAATASAASAVPITKIKIEESSPVGSATSTAGINIPLEVLDSYHQNSQPVYHNGSHVTDKLLEDIISLNRPYRAHSPHSTPPTRSQSSCEGYTSLTMPTTTGGPHDMYFDQALTEYHSAAPTTSTNTILDNFNWDDSFSWTVGPH